MKDWVNRSLKGGLLAFLLLIVAFADVHAATTNLGINEPTVGADADTWGTKINTALDRIDATVGGSIYGLTLSTAGSSGTFGIASGGASGMALASAYTKTTSSWAVGTAAGALDTGAIANNTWYHVWLIERVDTSVVDVLISTSATAPSMPANYTRKRRIGSMLTDGSAHWKKFSQNGDEFLWDATVQDASNVGPASTAAQTVTLTVPTGLKVNALVSILVTESSGASALANVTPLDVSDEAVSGAGAFTLYSGGNGLSTTQAGASLNIRTNTSAQVRLRLSTTTQNYYANTRGWIDRRGRDS